MLFTAPIQMLEHVNELIALRNHLSSYRSLDELKTLANELERQMRLASLKLPIGRDEEVDFCRLCSRFPRDSIGQIAWMAWRKLKDAEFMISKGRSVNAMRPIYEAGKNLGRLIERNRLAAGPKKRNKQSSYFEAIDCAFIKFCDELYSRKHQRSPSIFNSKVAHENDKGAFGEIERARRQENVFSAWKSDRKITITSRSTVKQLQEYAARLKKNMRSKFLLARK